MKTSRRWCSAPAFAACISCGCSTGSGAHRKSDQGFERQNRLKSLIKRDSIEVNRKRPGHIGAIDDVNSRLDRQQMQNIPDVSVLEIHCDGISRKIEAARSHARRPSRFSGGRRGGIGRFGGIGGWMRMGSWASGLGGEELI